MVLKVFFLFFLFLSLLHCGEMALYQVYICLVLKRWAANERRIVTVIGLDEKSLLVYHRTLV